MMATCNYYYITSGSKSSFDWAVLDEHSRIETSLLSVKILSWVLIWQNQFFWNQ
jgi:hypothetical protein